MLVDSGETFSDILAADMWNYNYMQLGITAESMMRLLFITDIEVTVSEEAKPMFSNYKAQDGKVGKVRIYSDTSVVLNQIESGVYSLVINAIIKTIDTIKKLDSLDKNFERRVMDRTQKLRETVGQLDKEQVALKLKSNLEKKVNSHLGFKFLLTGCATQECFQKLYFKEYRCLSLNMLPPFSMGYQDVEL
jgi:hypothetical protein